MTAKRHSNYKITALSVEKATHEKRSATHTHTGENYAISCNSSDANNTGAKCSALRRAAALGRANTNKNRVRKEGRQNKRQSREQTRPKRERVVVECTYKKLRSFARQGVRERESARRPKDADDENARRERTKSRRESAGAKGKTSSARVYIASGKRERDGGRQRRRSRRRRRRWRRQRWVEYDRYSCTSKSRFKKLLSLSLSLSLPRSSSTRREIFLTLSPLPPPPLLPGVLERERGFDPPRRRENEKRRIKEGKRERERARENSSLCTFISAPLAR